MKRLRKVEWIRLRAQELEHAASLEDAIVILPTGAVEQHGRHLPEGTDAVTVERIAIDAANELKDSIPVIVLPVLSVGVSLHHMRFPGSLTLSPTTFRSVVQELAESVFGHGFRHLVFLNGHGGNNIHLRTSAVEVSHKWGRVVPVANYWDLMASGKEHLTEEPPAFPGHAGQFETALQLWISEDDVSMADTAASYRIPRNDYVGERAFIHRDYMQFTLGSGINGDPTQATVEQGQQLYSLAVAGVVGFLRDFVGWDVDDAGSLFQKRLH